MIDIEHDALRAFEENALAAFLRLVQQPPGRRGERQDLGRDFDQRGEKRRTLHLGRAQAAQQRVVMHEQMIELRGQTRGIGEVADPDRAPANLVLIGGADTAAGGADLVHTARLLARAVDLAMRGQDQRRVLGKLQIVRRDRDSFLRDRLDLAKERPGIDHHAAADDRQLSRPHDARGQ